MAPPIDKPALVAALSALLRKDYEAAETAANTTAAGATHEESRAENDKDTRGLEATYLARGQAERVVAIQADMQRVIKMMLRDFDDADKITMSAVVHCEVDENPQTFFLAPAGGGKSLTGWPALTVVTPQSPVGRALIGKVVGDIFELRVGARVREFEIAAIE